MPEPGPGSLTCVFVYGTLRSGFDNVGRDVLTRHGDPLAEATVPGKLYDLGSFPALVEPDSSDDRVKGEVYELTRKPATAIERLDRYEGARGPSPLPYERRRARANTPDASFEVWVYVWTEEPGPQAEPIPSGDYIDHITE
jgi:gamma-glutamylcyclotransferase (GGCT)/AIG2-like uncharacterized protein YtfP